MELTLFVREARRREAEKQGTPALKMIAVAQMLQFALGDCEHWGENEHGTAMMWWDVDFYDDELMQDLIKEGVIEPRKEGLVEPQNSDSSPFPGGCILKTLGFQNDVCLRPQFHNYACEWERGCVVARE